MVLAWYNAPTDGKVPRSGETIKVGETVTITGPTVLCERGLHGSDNIFDTLTYRSNGIMTLVEIDGDIKEKDDKLCGLSRKTLGMLTQEQNTRVWRELAIDFAELAVGWSEQEPDQRVVDCIDACRQFLDGKITVEELLKFRDAAYAAADAAASAAACAAANAAASAAACAAAYAAADAAAYAANAAANAAACAAANAAAKDSMRHIAEEKFKKAMGL